MNLWVKRAGQLLLAVLFLMSCEDETYILGFINKNRKFNVGYQEFTIGEGTVISVDSVITDNLGGTSRILVGDYSDPIVGGVRAEAYTEFAPTNRNKLATSTTLEYFYDSLVFQMRLDYYSYGLVNEGLSKFKIHRITEDTLSYLGIASLKRYYANSSLLYETEPLGEVTDIYKVSGTGEKETIKKVPLKYTTLKDGIDTLIAKTRLSDEFGNELFIVALTNFQSEFSDGREFEERFKGFVFVPSESNAVIGLSTSNIYTRMRLHYHTTENGVNKDTLYRDFFFNQGVSFNNISVNRAPEFPTAEPPYTGVDPVSGNRAIQSGNLMVTKIDLEPYYTNFADTVSDKVLINSAEVVIESIDNETGYAPIGNFELRVLKENDRYMDYRKDADSVAMRGYSLVSDNKFYYVAADFSNYATNLSYNSSKGHYSGAATLFFQSLITNREKPADERLRYLGIYPATPAITGLSVLPIGKSINRSVFSKQNIKLRVYYTLPNSPNL